jgi:hypothetical protein
MTNVEGTKGFIPGLPRGNISYDLMRNPDIGSSPPGGGLGPTLRPGGSVSPPAVPLNENTPDWRQTVGKTGLLGPWGLAQMRQRTARGCLAALPVAHFDSR